MYCTMPFFHFVAVGGIDYVGVSASLAFARGSDRECHDVTIIRDDECEPIPENFFADLALVSGSDVMIDPGLTRVDIDDSLEDECGKRVWKLYTMSSCHRV